MSSAAAAQTDLSTPDGRSVLATFTTNPPGAEVYVSDTYIGISPATVRLNADTPTPYTIEPPDERHRSYSSTVVLGTDGAVNIRLVEAASQVQPQVSVSQPRPVGGVAGAGTGSATTPTQTSRTAQALDPAVTPLWLYVLAGSAVLLAGLFFALYLRGLRAWRRYPPLRELEREKLRARRELTHLKAEKAGLLKELEREKAREEKVAGERRAALEGEIARLRQTLKELRAELGPLEDEAGLVAHGLYEPLYDFEGLEAYERELGRVRERQKDMVRGKTAVLWRTEWVVEGSRARGKQMENQLTRLMLRAFNGECDALVTKVRYNTFHRIEKRILSLYDALNKLGRANNCELSSHYLGLKLDELRLVHEFQARKQAEAEEQRQIREQLREEEKARRELERAMIEAERDEARYARALEQAQAEAAQAVGEKQLRLEADIQRLQELLAEAHGNRERAKSRAEMTRSGYVYVVSNVGSFGEGVFKIGMTRRLDPMDRVYELGDASVPFPFDVHAIIFSEDAPALESALHRRFDHRRVNRVNDRKEFFRASLEEIQGEALSHRADVHFTLKARAEDYRKSRALEAREASGGAVEVVG